MSGNDLQDLDPREALEMWLERQKSEKAAESVKSYRYRVRQFVEWCEREDIANLNSLDGHDLDRFRAWRENGEADDYDEVRETSIRSILAALCLFLEFCADIDAVESDLHERVPFPEAESVEPYSVVKSDE